MYLKEKRAKGEQHKLNAERGAKLVKYIPGACAVRLFDGILVVEVGDSGGELHYTISRR